MTATRRMGLLFGGICIALGAGAYARTPAEAVPEDGSLALRAAWIRATQRDASAEYSFRTEDGAARAFVGEARFDVSEQGVRVTTSAGDWNAQLRTTAIGRGEELEAVVGATPVVSGNEATFGYAGVEERWISGPLGLEQTVTIGERPAGNGPLSIELAVEGDLTPVVVAGGNAVELRDRDGRVRARYSDLFVLDAASHAVPARMEIAAASIRLLIDDRDAEYPIAIDPLVGVEEAHLFASDPGAADQFGQAIALDGTTAIVGAFGDDTIAGTNAGSVYVFVQTGSAWTEQAHLFASDASANDLFGTSVSLSGDTLVVGARGDATMAGANVGSAYVFVRTGSVWTEQAHLFASDGGPADFFGFAVTLEGDTAIVGAPGDTTAAGASAGSVYMFVRSGGTWTEQAHVFASDSSAMDQFGFSLDVSGETVVIGAVSATRPAGVNAGAAYVFVRAGTVWSEQDTLIEPVGSANDFFGIDVGIDGGTIVVGASRDDNVRGVDAGTAYVFARSGTSWSLQAELIADDGAMADGFGGRVAILGNTLIVGAPLAQPGDVGGAYLYSRVGTTWSRSGLLTASDGLGSDLFGGDVALLGDLALVGANFDDTSAGVNAGSVYVLRLRNENGDPCTTGTTCSSGICVDGVCCNTTCGDGAADCQACSMAAGAAVNGTCGTARVGAICRPDLGLCDTEEVCNGVDLVCPADIVAVAGFSCRPSLGSCDIAEVCTGSSGACPTDARVAAGTECRASTDVCDAAEACSGAPTCPADVAQADGSSCSDDVACNGVETCAAGACTSGADLICDDGNLCTADACGEPDGCMNVAIDGCCRTDAECDDLDDCTGDICSGSGGTCSHTPLAVCIDGGPRIDAAIERDTGVRDGGPRDGAVDGSADGGDAGTPPGALGGGCGCAAAGTDDTSGTAATLGLLGLALVVARRRRNRR